MRMAFLVTGDLSQRHRLHIVARKHLLMPADNTRERGRQVPARMPAHPGAGFGAVEFEGVRFVRMRIGIELPGHAFAPLGGELLDDPLHRPRVGVGRAEIPAFGIGRAFGAELLGEGT